MTHVVISRISLYPFWKMKGELIKKKTVGQIAAEAITNHSDELTDITAADQGKEMLKGYMDHVQDAIKRGIKQYDGDFYVVVLTKREKLITNAMRNYFIARETCPTPDYDQAVWKYDRAMGSADFMWVIPSNYACQEIRANPLEYANQEKELMQFVLDFYDGTLLRKAQTLNNERLDAPDIVLYKKEENEHGRDERPDPKSGN